MEIAFLINNGFESACSAIRDTVAYNGILLSNGARDSAKIKDAWSIRNEISKAALAAKKSSSSTTAPITRMPANFQPPKIIDTVMHNVNGYAIELNTIEPKFKSLCQEFEHRSGQTFADAIQDAKNDPSLQQLFAPCPKPEIGIYMWYLAKDFFEIIHPENDLNTTMEMATDRNEYTGQQTMRANDLNKRQGDHVLSALRDTPDSELNNSDLFLRKCFKQGEDIISVVVGMQTTDKVIVSNSETDIMQFMWSMTTKTRKSKNIVVSVKNRKVNHKLGAQLVWNVLQHGRIYCLNGGSKAGAKCVRYIDRKSIQFGPPPQSLPVSYNSDDLIGWLLEKVPNWDFTVRIHQT